MTFFFRVMSMLCTDMMGVKDYNTHFYAFPLTCKRWSCEFCQPIRQNGLKRLARDGRPTTFLTLTCNPQEASSPAERARNLVDAWRKLRLRIKKRWNLSSLPFIAVFEATKAGEPHLHILLRTRYLPQKWVSDQMRQLTNAPIVDIRKVHSRQMAAAYVAKYIGKEPHQFDGTKRYWRSQDWDLSDPSGDYEIASRDETIWIRRTNFDHFVASLLTRVYDWKFEDGGVWLWPKVKVRWD